MAIDSTKLVDYAARNIPNSQIARSLGISDSRVTQLLADERVIELVARRQAEIAQEDVQTIIDLEGINNSLISRMAELVDESESLNECVNAYEKLNKIVGAKKGLSTESEDGIRTITMQMPVFVQNVININTNKRNEIVDIDDRAMTTMPTTAVYKLIKDHATSKDNTDSIDPDSVAL